MQFSKLNFFFFILLSYTLLGSNIKHPKREFRAVWIATVSNIDWPSKPNLSVRKQKEEFISIIERHKDLGINAVVVQVRPSADAIYKSEFEPWSEWLTGQQGKAPKPFYDPLKFMVEECHKRALEFHAWFNPFRLSNSVKKELASSHIATEKPEWVVTYGNKRILNPGIPQARTYVQSIVQDVVKRYDIDGVHFDDYFYPYPKKDLIFDDYAAFQTFNTNGLEQDDWRRANINAFVKETYEQIKELKPYVKFGISPFGIWRNKSEDQLGSETSGLPSYDAIYADSRKWLEEGWIDYITPQLYWSMDFKAASYRKLIDWWAENSFGKHLYAGHAVYKINNNYDKAWNDPAELQRQIQLNRQIDKVHGSVFFSSSKLLNNPADIQDSISNNLYVHPALIPTMKWKDNYAPESPQKIKTIYTDNGNLVKWNRSKKAVDGDQASYYVLYRFDEHDSVDANDPSKILAVLSSDQKNYLDESAQSEIVYNYGISALDRIQNESTLLTSFQKQTTDTEINNILVYPDVAVINRNTTINLSEGLTQLTFTNLSTKIIEKSITSNTQANAQIKDIQFKTYFPLENKYKLEKDSLNRVIRLYDEYLEEKNTSLKIIEKQRNKLIEDRSIIRGQALSIRNFNRARQKLEDQLKELDQQQDLILSETDSLSLIRDTLRIKTANYQKMERKEAGKVIVNVFTKSPQTIDLSLKYAVSDVMWQPEFNFHMASWGAPITLDYQLKLLQNTGVDWEQLPVSFTNNAYDKTIDNKVFKRPVFRIEKRRKGDVSNPKTFDKKPEQIISPYINLSFDKSLTVFSDSSQQRFEFRNSDLKTEFKYLMRADQSHKALAVAKLANWKAYNLTKGDVNLYINNAYAGSSVIAPDISTDTLDVILGKDDDVLVSKKLLNSVTTKKMFSIHTEIQRKYQLYVVNNKSKTINVDVEEFIPQSRDNRLKIRVTAVNATYNPENGVVLWNLELKPGESRILEYDYIIKFPKWTKVILE